MAQQWEVIHILILKLYFNTNKWLALAPNDKDYLHLKKILNKNSQCSNN